MAAKLGTIKARDGRRITAAEMKYMRSTAGYTWADYRTNIKIAKELKLTPRKKSRPLVDEYWGPFPWGQ
jgi:hypothetical protein